MSYFATSDDLSNKNAYPNVLRTIPADSVQVDAMYSLLSMFNWTYVSLLYEDTNYGHPSFRSIRAKKICLAKSLPVTLSNINETYKELANEKKSKYYHNIWVAESCASSCKESIPRKFRK